VGHLPYCLGRLSSLVLIPNMDRAKRTVSKSMDVNLKSLRKKGGTRIVALRCGGILPRTPGRYCR